LAQRQRHRPKGGEEPLAAFPRPVATHMDVGDNRCAMSADRRILNPLYSDNRLKL